MPPIPIFKGLSDKLTSDAEDIINPLVSEVEVRSYLASNPFADTTELEAYENAALAVGMSTTIVGDGRYEVASLGPVVWTRTAPDGANRAEAAAADAATSLDSALLSLGERSWQPATVTTVAGKYIQASDGSEQTSASYSYVEYTLTGDEEGFRVTCMTQLTTVAAVAWYNGTTWISSVASPSASARPFTNYQPVKPVGATKMRICGLTSGGFLLEVLIATPGAADAAKVTNTLLEWAAVSYSTITGKYIQLSDGSIQNDASYNYLERALTGAERGIRITVRQQLSNVAYVAWYNAQGGFISGTGGTGTASQLVDQVVMPPDGARLMRVTGLVAGTFGIEFLDVTADAADRIATAQADASAARNALLAWQAPTVTRVNSKYIQASDGSVQNSVDYAYDEYVLTGTETAFRASANAYLTNVAWVAWYGPGDAFISGTAGTAPATQYSGQALVKPAGAVKLRVTNYQAGTLLIEVRDVLPDLGGTAQASAAGVAKAATALSGYGSLAMTTVTSKYIQLSNGSIQNAAGFSYYEATVPAGTTSVRVSGISYLTNVAFVAFYNGNTFISGVAGSGAGKVQITDQVIAVPANTTKIRVTVGDMGFTDIQALSYVPAVASRVEAMEPQRAPTAYGYDYSTGTAFPTVSANDTDYMILVNGTSWSIGYNLDTGDAPVTTSAIDAGYALMFDVGAYPNGRAVAAYTDLLEQVYAGGKETPCSGIASAILSGLNTRLGFKPRLIMAVGGKAGNAYAGGASAGTGNKRGSDAYKECLRLVTRAKQISAAAGRKLKVLAVVSLSGENEQSVYPGINERQFIDALRQWRSNLEDDCRRITGQREPIPFVTYQTTWTGSTTFGKFSPIQSAQAKIHDRDPTILQVGPVYFVAEDAALSGHTTAAWTRRIGRLFGVAITEGLFGPYFVPLQVIDAWWVSSTVFRLRYPEALALESTDTNIVLSTLANPAGKGIEFDDGSGSAPLITGVTLTTTQVANDTLEVTLASAPTGPRKRALIAARYQSGGGILGRAKGGRSGIRSSASIDTDPLDNYVQHKWAMAEEVKL